MKEKNFKSSLARSICRLIELRQITGSDYHGQTLLLHYFDRFLVEQKFTGARLTWEIIEAYDKTLSHLVPRGRANRMCVVRQLCEYLSRSDPLTFVSESLRTPSSQATFAPYIYRQDEVRALLIAAAGLAPQGSLRGPTMQTLLGLLYSTGIRISEATGLNLADFYRDEKRLFIAKGKFRKARWVPMSPSTTVVLSRYVDRRRKMKPNLTDSPLFLNLRHRRLHYSTVSHCFHDLLEQCGIGHTGCRPRLHDLRHTFAVHRLLDWYRDGDNINARLAWLATYMGHVDIHSTQVYLHPTAELLEQANDRFHRHYLQHIHQQDTTTYGAIS